MNAIATHIRGGRPCAAFLLLSLLALCSCSLPHGYKGEGPLLLAAEHAPDASPGGTDVFAAYRISPGDVLEVIFREQDGTEREFVLSPLDSVNVNFLSSPAWNTQQRVRPNGGITLPYRPEVIVAGLTVPQATRKIESMYASILKDPKVFLYVNEFRTGQERLRASLYHPATGSTRLVTVQADGNVSLPFTGVLQAGGMPFVSFREQVRQAYRQQHGMDVDVLLNKSAGQQVYVVGMLQQPGAYPMNGPTSVLQAISLARGFRDDAELNQVILVRRQGDTMICRPLDVGATLEGRGADGMVAVQSGDIVFVPRTRLASAAEVASQLATLTFFRGISGSLTWQMRDSNGNVILF